MYIVMQRSRQFNTLLFLEHEACQLCEDRETDALILAKLMAEKHSTDCFVAAPIEVSPGVFRLYTSNYNIVEYYIKEKSF